MNLTVTLYHYFHVFRKGIHYGRSHAVKSAGNLISATAELSSGMKNRVYHFHRRSSRLVIDIYGNTSSVVRYRY